jgi:glycosyltransferase involved in cell wall biosynthesis
MTVSAKKTLQLVRGASRPKIAVVIPAFNEERNIEKVLADVQALRRERRSWEVLSIVVNDGSTDATERVLETIAARYGARYISLPQNIGIGGAVQTGFRSAVRWGADVTLQLDGDGQHPAAGIPAIVEPVLARKADVVVGSRYVEGAGGNVSTSFRQAGTRFFSWLLRCLAGVRVRDATSGFRAFGAEAAEFIARDYPDDYPEVEAYVPLARRRFSILEVPVTMRPRRGGASSITPFRSAYYMVKVAFATFIQTIRPLPPRRKDPDGR